MSAPIDISNAKFVDCDFAVVGDGGSIEIEVADGTVLHYKVAILNVRKSDKTDELGKPIYAVASIANITVSAANEEKT